MARDHYVMKSHLDKFVHRLSSRKVLYPYQKQVGLVPQARNGIGPKGLGWAEDFYAQVQKDGTLCRKLDESLKVSEDAFFTSGMRTPSTLSRCIFDPGFFPSTHEERRDITYCAAFSHCRAPVQVHNMAMTSLLTANIAALNAFSPNGEATLKHLAATGEPDEQARAHFADAHQAILEGRLRVGFGKQYEKQAGFNIFKYEELLWIMIEMRWQLLEAAQEHFFLTSDNPVVIDDSSTPRKRFIGIRQSPAVEVWYPISYKYGFLMGWRQDMPEGRFLAGHSQTRRLNRLMIKRCYRNVYSPLREEWIDSAVRTETFSPLLDRFTTLKAWLNSTPSSIVNITDALEHGEKADIFETMKLH